MLRLETLPTLEWLITIVTAELQASSDTKKMSSTLKNADIDGSPVASVIPDTKIILLMLFTKS